ncbi:MAG: family 78 glycoside hydrolase catalytic domain [Bacteroidota bacterium]|nr:family 78 glycoside hydrolase catalytic domain [Bacteroidota bacterium]
MNKLQIISFFILYAFVSTAVGQNALSTSHLTCEYQTNPSGIDALHPRLSWQLKSDFRNQRQSAYQILVADSPEKLSAGQGNIWDSRIVKSSHSIQIEYAGKPLQAAGKYYWKVKVWNQDHKASAWSETASWQMGLLVKSDWGNARWITLSELDMARYTGLTVDSIQNKVKNILPQFRKDFKILKPVKSAIAFVSGLGQFDMFLNGQKVGDHFMDPDWSNYEKYCYYVTFDITPQLQEGDNTVGVMLGNGFYDFPRGRYRKPQLVLMHGLPKMICKILVKYQDGSSEIVESNASWKAAQSPVTFSTIYGGEDYDATIEQEGWDKPGFDDSKWQPSVVVKGNDTLLSQQNTPNKVMETLPPVKIFKAQNGHWVYDFGQNASGIVRISVQGNAGAVVKITPAELVNPDGTVNQDATGKPYYFSYRLSGKGEETWQPQFTYYGFRYAQVEGAVPEGQDNPDALPVIKALTGLHTRNSAEKAGNFQCSNDLFNRTARLIDWAIKSNMSHVFTDCPHREKLGWLEQTHLMGASTQYNYNISSLFSKTISDMRSSQLDDGLIPSIAPEFCVFNDGKGQPNAFRDSPEWGSAWIILPWYMYQWYGDTRLMKDNYEGMKKYVAYLGSKAKDYIVDYGLGDWYDLGPKHPGSSQLTSMGVTATATWYYDVNILSKAAKLLGIKNDVIHYNLLAQNIKDAFNKKYFHKDTYQYDRNSQAANAMSLYMGLVDRKDRPKVTESLINDIRSRNNSLTAGDVGYRYVLRALEEGGASKVIFDMNNRSDVPGYGYQLEHGATSLTESWQALRDVSNNHLMLGHIMEWFYSGLAGIRQEENSVAFKDIVIKPEVVGDVTFVKAQYGSMYGQIKSEWEKKGKVFTLKINIPVNTHATVYLPFSEKSRVMESDKIPGKYVHFLRNEAGYQVYKVGSGSYDFRVENFN